VKRLVTLGVAAALALGIVAAAWAEPVTLEYKFIKGDVTKYNISCQVKAQLPNLPGMDRQEPMTFSMSMLEVMKVTDVYPDGSGRLKMWVGNIVMSAPGISLPSSDKMPATTMYMKMSKSGKLLGMEMPDLAAAIKKAGARTSAPPVQMPDMSQMLGEMNQTSALPEGPVEVGSCWQTPIPLPMGLGNMDMTSLLAGANEQVAGGPAAKLTQNVKGSIDVSQAINAFASTFLSAFNQASGGKAANMQIPNITGTLDITGTINTFFSTQLGKLVGQDGAGTMTINVHLPSEITKTGQAPADIKVVIDGSMKVTKV